MLSKQQFENYKSAGFNRIPVVREILADLDTPVSTFLKLANQSYSYLFESVQGGEKWGRYSIIGLPCETRVTVQGDVLKVIRGDDVIMEKVTEDPLQEIALIQTQYKIPEIEGVPKF